MKKGISKNDDKERTNILLDKDIKKEMKKAAIDFNLSLGELIEKLYLDSIPKK